MSYVNLFEFSGGLRRRIRATLYILSQVVPAARGFPCLMVFSACFVVLWLLGLPGRSRRLVRGLMFGSLGVFPRLLCCPGAYVSIPGFLALAGHLAGAFPESRSPASLYLANFEAFSQAISRPLSVIW